MGRFFSTTRFRLLVSLAFLFLVCAGTYAQTPPRQMGLPNTPPNTRRVALVLGNAAYTNIRKLKNPANDAGDIATALRELGFEVIDGTNLSQIEMKRKIRDFGTQLRNAGIGVFYYAGHGVQLEGRNYLLPIEIAVENEADVADSAVDLQFVLDQMKYAANGLNIVILDACRNNPFEGKTRDARDGLAEVRAATGTLIAYATAPGNVASDGATRNGAYTEALLKQLKRPGVEVLDMFRLVREEVYSKSQQKQVPWTNESLIGRFCFGGCEVERKPVAVTPAPTPAVPAGPTMSRIDPLAAELSYWDTIKNSNDPEEYKDYLRKYPNGQFVDIARRRAARPASNTANPPPSATPAPSAVNPSQQLLGDWDLFFNMPQGVQKGDIAIFQENGVYKAITNNNALTNVAVTGNRLTGNFTILNNGRQERGKITLIASGSELSGEVVFDSIPFPLAFRGQKRGTGDNPPVSDSAPLVGKWSVRMALGDEEFTGVLIIRKEGGGYTAKMDEDTLRNVRVSGNQMAADFTAKTESGPLNGTLVLAVSGNDLSGTVTFNNLPLNLPLSGKRVH